MTRKTLTLREKIARWVGWDCWGKKLPPEETTELNYILRLFREEQRRKCDRCIILKEYCGTHKPKQEKR